MQPNWMPENQPPLTLNRSIEILETKLRADGRAPRSHEDLIAAARELAKSLIRRSVAAGETVSDIKRARSGMAGPGYGVAIGGWMDGKAHSPDFITVSSVRGQEVNLIFKLRDIYREVRGEILSVAALEDFQLEPG